MYTKIGCTHICICTNVRQCTVMLKCTYSYLKKYMYLKSFFIQKISPINMAMYPLFAVPASRWRTEQRVGRTTWLVTSTNNSLWPLLPFLYSKEVGGGWSYIFLFSPTFTFISWPNFNTIFHNWLYSPVAKTLDPSSRSPFKSHGSNPGQKQNFENLIFLSVGGSIGTKVIWIDLFIH